MNISTVTVIGANGTMGALVAGMYASFGGAKVYLISRSIEKSMKAVDVAVQSVRADSIRSRLIPKTYEDLKECIESSDLVFETITENLQYKKDINDKIAKYRRKGTIITTGTSGLSINELAESFDEEGKSLYFGTHFFNPPYNLPLCEIICTDKTNQHIKQDLSNYLQNIMMRKIIFVKDKPAFLGNRIGFQFMNEAAQLAEKFKDQGGVDYIDSIFGPFTGRGLSPLVTADFVGLDVHKAIVKNLYDNTSDFSHTSFEMPSYLEILINEGKLGRKVREGLYKTIRLDNGEKVHLVYDINNNAYREKQNYNFSFSRKMVNAIKEGQYLKAINVLKEDKSQEAKICQYLMYKYVLYSLVISKEVADSYHSADIAMGYGFNWIPPVALLDLIGGLQELKKGLEENDLFNNSNLELFNKLDNSIDKSEIDARKFLKAHF